MGIKSELHEAILKRGGKVPPYGGIAAAMDELNKLPGGGGVSSWNDLTDKPFGIEFGGDVIFPETALPVSDDIASLSSGIGLVAGKTYTAVINGNIYTVQPLPLEEEGMVFGVGAEFDQFYIMDIYPEYQEMIGVPAALQWSSTHHTSITMLIAEGVANVARIPQMYVPRFVITFTNNDGTWTADKTYEELYEAYSNDIDIKCKVKNYNFSDLTLVNRDFTFTACYFNSLGNPIGATIRYTDNDNIKLIESN